MRHVTFSCEDDTGDKQSIKISYVDDGTIKSNLMHFREFLSAMSFTDDTLNKFLDTDELYS